MSEQGPFGRRSDPAHPPPPPAPGPEPPAEPERAFEPAPPRPPARVSNFTWLLGVVCILGLAYITLNTVVTDAPGSEGVAVGEPLPPFAAPLASSTRRCEDRLCNANISLAAGDRVERKACDVRLPDVLNVCALAERGPVALAFVASRSKRCQDQVDVLERVRRSGRFPRVQFAAVFVRGDRADVRAAVRSHGWSLPVGHDTNGAVSNVYAVAVCPTITFARQGGEVQSTSLDLLDERALGERLRAIGG